FTGTTDDGGYPAALIQATDGNFYGTTLGDGGTLHGTVFRLSVAAAGPDTTPPLLILPPPLVVEAPSAAGSAVPILVPGGAAPGGPVTLVCKPPLDSVFTVGTTTVSCTATDSQGNPVTHTFTVTVRDTTPPVLQLPADITAPPTSPTGAVVTFTATA